MTEPLVILPGFMADARSFLSQIVEFGTDRPVLLILPTGADTVEQMSARALTHLPERFALLGHGHDIGLPRGRVDGTGRQHRSQRHKGQQRCRTRESA